MLPDKHSGNPTPAPGRNVEGTAAAGSERPGSRSKIVSDATRVGKQTTGSASGARAPLQALANRRTAGSAGRSVAPRIQRTRDRRVWFPTKRGHPVGICDGARRNQFGRRSRRPARPGRARAAERRQGLHCREPKTRIVDASRSGRCRRRRCGSTLRTPLRAGAEVIPAFRAMHRPPPAWSPPPEECTETRDGTAAGGHDPQRRPGVTGPVGINVVAEAVPIDLTRPRGAVRHPRFPRHRKVPVLQLDLGKPPSPRAPAARCRR